ncbi:MAG: TIGR03986 family CRISPR-associated RAMP protein, partial [Bacillota bacterium]
MKRPSHVDPSKDERRSRAPYNFVALPADIISVPVGGPGSGIVEHDRYVPGRHTGWIDISMTTETPLFVRCAPPAQHGDDIDDKRDVHRRHFFHHGDESRPVIPGSSIRGMVRSLVEIMAYGKMQWVSDKALVYRAVGDRSSLGEAYRTMMLGRNQSHMPNREMKFDYPAHQLSGGYLERKGSDWFIRPAKTYEGESFIHVRYEDVEKTIGGRGRQRVHDIYVVPTKRVSSSRGNRGNKALILNLTIAQQVSFEPKEGYVHAKLVESGHMGKPIGQPPDPHQKHMHCAIYDPDPNAEPIPIPFQMWARYMEDLAISRGERTKTRCLSGHEEPLFYLLDDSGDLVFFGPTMLFRVPYRCTIHSYIPEHLRRPSETDLAEAMFGAVGDSTSHSRSTNPAVRGRMFFEDAIWDGQGGNPFLEGDEGFRTPKILSSPKPTAFQHYLVQTQPNDRGTLCHYDSGPDATEIRGHKLYWHKKGVPDSDIFEPALVTDPRDTQHTIIRPVKPGTIFTGRIRFENLNDEELGALLSAVDLPPSKRHKLGMGKPYGMGSVRISCSLQLTDRQVRYSR